VSVDSLLTISVHATDIEDDDFLPEENLSQTVDRPSIRILESETTDERIGVVVQGRFALHKSRNGNDGIGHCSWLLLLGWKSIGKSRCAISLSIAEMHNSLYDQGTCQTFYKLFVDR
jgi:hypothetical protein